MTWGDLVAKVWDWIVVFVLGGVLVPRLYERLTVKATTARLLIEEDPHDPMIGRRSEGNHAFFHVRVRAVNRYRPWRARPPKDVRASISITDLASGQTVINAPARWVEWPEPMNEVPVVVLATGQIQFVEYQNREELNRQKTMDFAAIDAHGAQRIDVAVKVQGQTEIYFWNNDNYRQGRRIDAHQPLGNRDYDVEVRLEYEGGSVIEKFRLSNGGASWTDVRIYRL